MNFENILLQVLFFLVRLNILKSERYKLDINPISDVYWISNTEVFVNEEDRSFRYDVVDRQVVEEFERKENEVLGYIRGTGVVSCEWYNREIESPEEFSTHLLQKRGNEVVLDIELRPTTSVIECRDEIILKTLPPIEEKYFEFSDELFELDDYIGDMLSPNYKRLLSRDSLGKYWITEFRF